MALLTLTNTYDDASGAFYTGRVLFQPTSVLQDATNGVTIGFNPVVATLNASGAISLQLHYTDDPGITSANPALATWCYRVTEQLSTPAGTPELHPPYYLNLPLSLGASAVLARLPRFGQPSGYGFFAPMWGI